MFVFLGREPLEASCFDDARNVYPSIISTCLFRAMQGLRRGIQGGIQGVFKLHTPMNTPLNTPTPSGHFAKLYQFLVREPPSLLGTDVVPIEIFIILEMNTFVAVAFRLVSCNAVVCKPAYLASGAISPEGVVCHRLWTGCILQPRQSVESLQFFTGMICFYHTYTWMRV